MSSTVPLLRKNGMAESSKDIESGCEKVASLDKKLRKFAFKLALIQKAASTLGAMNFIWATVVLLGGFSQSLKSIDFLFVKAILLVEGLRILCRQGELKTAPMTLRSSSPDCMLQLIHQCSLLIQQCSAIACIVLSSLRIHKQQYGSDDNLNRNRALNLFYWLSIVESILTLFGFVVRAYLAHAPNLPHDPETSSYSRFIFIVLDFYKKFIFSLVVGQNWNSALEDDGFDDFQLNMVLRYFNDTYRRCINGSVFDGLKVDFVSYSMEMLQSIDDNEQAISGAQLLSALVKSDRLPSEKLTVIGTTPGVLKRLIELLNWEKPQEQEIRREAGEIIYKLVEIPRNRNRVMDVSESMESIASFLYDRNQIGIHSSKYQGQFSDTFKYKYSDFTVLGLRILKIFANDPDSCAKIGSKKGLLCKIIELNPEASESEILGHLKITPIEKLESLARQQHDCDNIEAERSDDPNL